MSEPHDTVVVSGGGGSSGAVLLAVVLLVIVLAVGWYFLLGPGATHNGNPNDINVNVTVPTSIP